MIKVIAITSAKGTISPKSIPEKYNGEFCDGEYFYFFESKEEHQSFLDSLPKQPETKSREVPTWKLRAILKEIGLLPTIDTAIAALPEPTKSIAEMAWEYAPSINQYSPTTQMIKQACELTDEQVEEIFTTAENIAV